MKNLFGIIKNNKLIVCIILLAAILRFIGLYPNFINHPDEGWIQTYSAKLFYNAVVHGDFDPHTYKYGSFIFFANTIPYFVLTFFSYLSEKIVGTILPVAGVSHIKSFKDYVLSLGPAYFDTTIFIFQRALTALQGVLSVWIVYLISKKLFNKPTALLAALFLAIIPLHVRDSHYITTDVPATFFVLVAFLFMVYILKSGKLKWYILSGIMVGFSTSIRYFPTALLAYPIAVLLDPKKDKQWIPKVLLGVLGIIFGIFLGVPYLFTSPGARVIFQQDLAKWVAPWYTTTITTYLTQFAGFLFSHGKQPFPDITTLIPTFFFPYYLSFLFFKGLGALPSIITLLGLVILLAKSFNKFIFLSIVPLFIFVYISSYLHVQYERLAVPIMPFAAIFMAVFFYYTWHYFRKYQIRLLLIVLLMATIIFPLWQSLTSSWECGDKTVYEQSQDWIDKNMPDNPKVAYKTYTAFPSSKQFDHLFEIKPNGSFSLEESRNLGADYAFINKTTVLDYFAYRFATDFFIAPKDIYQNNFVVLSLYEYETRAKKLNELSKPSMCAQDVLDFYKLPPLGRATNTIKKFAFGTARDLEFWKLQDYSVWSKGFGISVSKQEEALDYKIGTAAYTPPRVVSKKIPVKENQIYTFSGLIKFSQALTQDQRDGFLRIDFYTDEKADTILPGSVVALSPRTYGDPEFRKTEVSAKSPKGAKFMTLSLQVNAEKSFGDFYFKDLELLGP